MLKGDGVERCALCGYTTMLGCAEKLIVDEGVILDVLYVVVGVCGVLIEAEYLV